MSRADQVYPEGRAQEVLIALRGLLSRHPCAARFCTEQLSELLYEERYLTYRVAEYEVECALEALSFESEVLA
jgi:hypothetical protein